MSEKQDRTAASATGAAVRIAMVDAGQHAHVHDLSAALARRGHEVTVYTRRTQRGNVPAPGGFRVAYLPEGPRQFAQRLVERARRHPPDVVHTHHWIPVAGAALNVPLIQTIGVPDRSAFERSAGWDAARLLATCTDQVRELIRLGVPRTKITVIPCGVDVDRFTPDGPRAPKGAPRRVLSVGGRLLPHKGFRELISALPRLPDTELVIVGGPAADRLRDDPEARRLASQAEALRVRDRLRLTGWVDRDRMPALLRSADVVACVPWYEPLGAVPLEAMACGVPVLASAVGGLADTVVDGITGVLVPPRRVGALASALRRLLADPIQRDTLAASGWDRARARYTWDRIAADTERAYRDVTAGT
jgi:glycosyltransferase involved in cell wall biosynthesis